MKDRKITIYIFLGTTAELIKLLPVIKELQKRKVEFRLVLSGQTVVDFEEFVPLLGKQKPYFSFESKGNRVSPFNFFLWSIKTLINGILWSVKEFSVKNKSEYIFLVQGDTVTALIGSLISKVNGIKLAHVEAGLRSHNFLEPFPEEICRTIISYFSDLNFCPNSLACKNIQKRKGKKINTYWNTSVEAMNYALQTKVKQTQKLTKPYFILILHRQEHINFRRKDTEKIINAIIDNTRSNLQCLFLAHKVTKRFLQSMNIKNKIYKNKSIKVVEHLPYLEFVKILSKSQFILTDGGGNHTESHFLGKPCLILRKNIEQNEGIGENVVLSQENPKIIKDFIKNYKKYRRPKQKVKVWPSKIIVDEILDL